MFLWTFHSYFITKILLWGIIIVIKLSHEIFVTKLGGSFLNYLLAKARTLKANELHRYVKLNTNYNIGRQNLIPPQNKNTAYRFLLPLINFLSWLICWPLAQICHRLFSICSTFAGFYISSFYSGIFFSRIWKSDKPPSWIFFLHNRWVFFTTVRPAWAAKLQTYTLCSCLMCSFKCLALVSSLLWAPKQILYLFIKIKKVACSMLK